VNIRINAATTSARTDLRQQSDKDQATVKRLNDTDTASYNASVKELARQQAATTDQKSQAAQDKLAEQAKYAAAMQKHQDWNEEKGPGPILFGSTVADRSMS